MLKDKKVKSYIQNYTPHRDVVDVKLCEAYAMIVREGDRKRHGADLKC